MPGFDQSHTPCAKVRRSVVHWAVVKVTENWVRRSGISWHCRMSEARGPPAAPGAAPTGGGVSLGRRAELGLTVGRARAGGTAFGYSMSVWKREAQAAHEQIMQWELDRYLQLF
jgi:hypothetical protein